jgi:hypothetical protein
MPEFEPEPEDMSGPEMDNAPESNPLKQMFPGIKSMTIQFHETSNPLRAMLSKSHSVDTQANEAFRGKDGSVYWRHAGSTWKKDAQGQKKEIPESEYIAAKSPAGQKRAQKAGRTNLNTSDVPLDTPADKAWRDNHKVGDPKKPNNKWYNHQW